MAGLRVSSRNGRLLRVAVLTMALAFGAALIPVGMAGAQQPAAPTDIFAAGNVYKGATDAMARLEHLPCLDPFTRAGITTQVQTAIDQLGAFANAQGDLFMAEGSAGGRAHGEQSVTATKWADTLQRLLSFIISKPDCKGPFPWDPPPRGGGGGGLTDGPNGGWPDGVTPPSRTQIPKCKDDEALRLIEVIKAKLPDEKIKMAQLTKDMDALRDEIIDLLAQQASAKRKGLPDDPNIQSQIDDKQARYAGLAFQLRSVEIQYLLDTEDLALLEALPPCKQQTGYLWPPRAGGGEQQYITYATDSTTHCTFTPGTFATILTTYFDDGSPGGAVPAPDDTPAAGAPPTGGPQTAMAVPDRPVKPDDKKPDDKPTPTTTDITPAAPDDTPSEIPDDTELKVKQEVAEGGQTGQPLEGQTIKLLLSQKSDLPVPVDPKASIPARNSARDTKFAKSPDQCTTDASGGCKIQIATDDRASYGLPSPKKGVHRTYQLEIARPQTSGGVAELTPGKDKIDPKALQSLGNKLASSTFKIGNRSFIRFALESKYGIAPSLASKLKEAYGPTYEEDICDEKYPGRLSAEETPAAFGTSESELPGATISLRFEQTKRGVSR